MIVVGGKKLLPLTFGVMSYWFTFLIVVSLVMHISGASIALIVGSVCIMVACIVLLDSYYMGKEWRKKTTRVFLTIADLRFLPELRLLTHRTLRKFVLKNYVSH